MKSLFFALVLSAVGAAAESDLPDQDGDGAPDATDCAPSDPRLSSTHRYYLETDGDGFGARGSGVPHCDVRPFPGGLIWGWDPDDSDNRVLPAILPRGSRRLGVDFWARAEDGISRLDRARELGAEAATLDLQWALLETAPGVFDGPQAALLPALHEALVADGFVLHLRVSPIVQDSSSLPPDLAGLVEAGTLHFDDPAFVARFEALLDFVRSALPDVEVKTLHLGYEVDRHLARQPELPFWEDFTSFLLAVAPHARSLWGAELQIAVTATHLGLMEEPAASRMRALNAATDLVAVTYFPRRSDFTAVPPQEVGSEMEALLGLYPGEEFAFFAGYPSSPALFSSETMQSQFLHAFFEFWDRNAERIPFASFARLSDLPPAEAAFEAGRPIHGATAETIPRATAYFQSLGLRGWDGSGDAKSGYHTLRNLAFERGWWRVEPPRTRSFLLGFTPHPYDLDPGEPLDDEVMDGIFEIVSSGADLVAHHFDSGVPWIEALADDFSSPELPYSEHLRDTWAKHRDRHPPGITVAVSVNPLGIPRSLLAPYWGFGEGFYHDGDFQRVGTGAFQDYGDRLPPAPFDDLGFDSPLVQTAFLNYVRRVIDYFHPRYLILGLEVNLALDPEDPAELQKLVSLQKFVYEGIRAEEGYDGVKVVTSFAGEYFMLDELGVSVLIDGIVNPDLRALHLQALEDLLPYTDVVGLSLYPLKTLYGANQTPPSTFDHLFRTIRSLTDKPIAITETGFSSEPIEVGGIFYQGSQEKQERYLRLLVSEVEKHGGAEFLVNFATRDLSAHLRKLEERSSEDPPFVGEEWVRFLKLFEFVGLYDAAGNPKPAAELFRDLFSIPVQRDEAWIEPIHVTGPGGALELQIEVGGDGRLGYRVSHLGTTVIESSPLGIVVEGVDLGTGVTHLTAGEVLEVDRSYATRGKHSLARDRHREIAVAVRRIGSGDVAFEVQFRVYDDGVAFRYVLPGTGPRLVERESTVWNLPAGSFVWFQPNTGNYESIYFGAPLGQFENTIGPPVTIELPEDAGFLTLTEGALAGYSGMTLRGDLASLRLVPEFLDDSQWTVSAGSASPWRLAIFSPDLNGLVSSDLVENVSPPPDPALFPQGLHTPWIRPGKAVWSFWLDFASGYSYDVQKQYVDYAHELGVEYVVVDAWWEDGFPLGDKDAFERLAELVDYAHGDGRNVDLFVWKSWWELIGAPEREAFFQKVKAAGAVGVKVDNNAANQSESQISVQLYEDLLKDAARHELMVNFHGNNKPTGRQRTYPNEITREGFAGLELNGLAWEFDQFLPPRHNAVLPFTRFVAGPGDYSPITFDERKLGDTTVTHQLATAGIFESPLMHLAEDPALLLSRTEVLDVVRELPTTWDETRVLPGSEIGELVAMARRSGSQWYLFVLNGNAEDSRTLPALDLSFLGAGSYRAILLADESRTTFERRELTGFLAETELPIELLPGGGFVSVFTPEPPAARTFRMGFTSIPPANTQEGWEAGYVMLRDHADLVAHNFQEGVPWVEALASSDYRSYSESLQTHWNLLKAADQAVVPEHDLYVLLNPIEVSYERLAPYWGADNQMPLPAPWNGHPFNHPDVKTAFTNYVIAAIEHFEPTYLAIAVEANILLAKRPWEWQAFKELQEHVYITIKGLYPDLTVFTTVHYEHMLGLHRESFELQQQVQDSYPGVLENEVKLLMQHSDLIAFSTYPYMVAENPLIGDDNVVPEYYQRAYAVASEVGKPIAIDQTGYISEDLYFEPLDFTIPGSEELQNNFFAFLLQQAVAHEFRFVLNFVGVDYGDNYGTHPTTLTWAHAGLLREDGTPKPALATWDSFLQVPHAGDVEPPPPEALPVELLGNVHATTVSGNRVDFAIDGGKLARVELLDDDVLRVRVSVSGAFTDWLSGAIEPAGLEAPDASIFDRQNECFLVTPELSVIVQKRPFRVIALRPDGSVVSADTESAIGYVPDLGVLFNRKIALDSERYFGLGLRGGPLDRRGDGFVMRNTDHFGYGELDGPLYSSTPFFYGFHQGAFYGLFVDSPAVPFLNMDTEGDGSILIGAHQQELDYYLFAGPRPEDVAGAYARVTGLAPLPPRWALGFHQSRFGYDSWEQILDVAETFRELRIPLDAVYLDLDYMKDLDWFSWDPVRFADPVGRNQILESMGVKRVNILDPSIQPDDPLYDFLSDSGFFLMDSGGTVVRNEIFHPFGEVSWFDYTRAEAGEFYKERLKELLDTGVTGIWNDINEPAANFMPHAIYDFDGQKRTDREARNLYALKNVMWTREAMLEHRPDERPFILARSGYAGSHRYNANWSGDSLSTFESLRVSIQMSLHMSLSGMVLFGHDIGGFLGTPNPELLTRWMQFAAFNPFMRNHAVNTSEFTEPWVYGEPYTSIIREAIEQRYRWMPYLYSLVERSSRTGEPALAPTYFQFWNDPRTFDQDTEILLGPYLLAAPVFEEGATTRTLYLPEGTDWYDYHSGERYTGGQEITVSAPLSRIPIFLRAGAVLPSGPLMQHADEPVPPRMDVDLYPSSGSTELFTIYEDDGISFDYQQGDYLRTRIASSPGPSSWEVDIQQVEGGFLPPDRPWTLRFHDVGGTPSSVTLGGLALPRVENEAELASVESGWFQASPEGAIHVRLRGASLPAVVRVQTTP